MITNKRKQFLITISLILGSFIAAYLCCYLLPNVFETWNAQTVDQLFVLRSSIEAIQPQYYATIAHVDLNNSSFRNLKSPYVHRAHFAQVVRNLAATNVSAQVYDFVFAAPLAEKGNQAFMEATKEAGNVYFGLTMELHKTRQPLKTTSKNPETDRYLDKTKSCLAISPPPLLC